MTTLQRKLQQNEARAIGPCYVGLILAPTVEDDKGGRHSIVFLPDRNNPSLRAAGKPLHFYYLPNKPRLDQFSDGSFIFGLQRFSGIMDPSRSIGEDGYSELAGGTLTFTATLAPPAGVVDKAFAALREMLPSQDNNHYKWSHGSATPVLLGPVPLRSNTTVLHALKYADDPMAPKAAFKDNPDAWAFEIQGAGAGALNVQASNAFTVMLGRRPVELLYGSAKSGASQVTLENHISYDVWSLVSKIKIEGDWESICTHFSAEVAGGISWFRANASAQVNKLIETGAVTVTIEFGAGVVDTDHKTKIEAAADAVADKLYMLIESKLKEANSSIQDEAKKGAFAQGLAAFQKNFWLGIAIAVTARKDVFSGKFEYSKEINEQVVRSEVLSSQMEGLFDETHKNPEALNRYFTEVFLEEAFRKVHVVTSAVANWFENEVGDPIHSLKVQIGYPDSRGEVNWKAAGRMLDGPLDAEMSTTVVPAIWTSENKDARFVFDFTRHGDRGAESEKIRVRTMITFKESPDVKVNELVEEYETDIHTITVRAESAGQLLIGRINLDMTIPEGNEQIDVLVRVKAPNFAEKVFRFTGKTLAVERFYKVWYAHPDEAKGYEYKVVATVKGKRFGQKSARWESDWKAGSGCGPLTVEIPEVPPELSDTLDEYLST